MNSPKKGLKKGAGLPLEAVLSARAGPARGRVLSTRTPRSPVCPASPLLARRGSVLPEDVSLPTPADFPARGPRGSALTRREKGAAPSAFPSRKQARADPSGCPGPAAAGDGRSRWSLQEEAGRWDPRAGDPGLGAARTGTRWPPSAWGWPHLPGRPAAAPPAQAHGHRVPSVRPGGEQPPADTMLSTGAKYAGKRRRKPARRSPKPLPPEGAKTNPSKRHRDRLNEELSRLTNLLPFPEDVRARLDKLSVLRLIVGYLKVKDYFAATLKDNNAGCSADPPMNPGRSEQTFPQVNVDLFSEGDLLLQALNGFLVAVTEDGYIFYVSPTVQDYLGFHQVSSFVSFQGSE
ncbi:protein trachealess-like [Macaca thibetana thibetana]|uniref:protein trachealess-like n=1 Tax=Macaca thibetana thibetana TaxID=257877 RepID=UPI0021BCD078|nr:protein trachealess-like [Macaca thibetana thibetana]